MNTNGRRKKPDSKRAKTASASITPNEYSYLKKLPGAGGSAGAGAKLLIRFAAQNNLKIA